MRDRAAFLRPIAHRGLHDAAKGIIENTTAAFEAAIAKGYGIECDVRPAACATPMVFHDLTLDRLVEAEGPIARHEAAALKRLAYRNVKGAMLDLAELFELVGGRVPLLVEIKSEWHTPDAHYLAAIAAAAQAYKGPVALMSFDPAVIVGIRALAPEIPRGIVSGQFAADCWWRDQLGPQRAYDLANLLDSGPAAPDFYAYDVNARPTPVTRFVREVEGLPLFTWTVRNEEQRETAARWADAPIFEGYVP
jgi:glycerophosphoryl diester phosphodiesterase